MSDAVGYGSGRPVRGGNGSGDCGSKRDATIGCYIRVPEDYSYDGWKIDFKTGGIRIVDYSPAEGNPGAGHGPSGGNRVSGHSGR